MTTATNSADRLADFHRRHQDADETFDHFFAALKQLLPEPNEALLRDAILRGVHDAQTRDQLRRLAPDVTLANAVALCRMADVLRGARSADAAATTTMTQHSAKATTSSTEAFIENPFAMQPEHMCGITGWHPKWLQKYANTKSFLVVYGLLGTIQSMAFLYFVVTLTTVEKRFKIPSYTTGLIISGNEISQILLSLVLSYAGGQRNRPRWIAWGVVFCALSCFILATPHLIYGPGDEALHLTEEYLHRNDGAVGTMLNVTAGHMKSANKLCTDQPEPEECNEPFSYVPLVLIFVSQFVLGIGTTLYYTLGHTYLDDNTRKTNTPMMLAYAMSLRMFGPVVGFLLGFVSLRMYIDPWSTPLITHRDPRWLGAWWFGWILLGFAMLLFSWLIGMFPKELPKLRLRRQQSEALEERPRFMRSQTEDDAERAPFSGVDAVTTAECDKRDAVPLLKDLPVALWRLLRNKLLMYNILSGIFYILGASGSITFLSKYMEVQFNKNASDATIVTGPMTLMGMVTGFLLSGWLISRHRPGPRKLFFWNVLVGGCMMIGHIANLYLTCDTRSQLVLPVTLRHGDDSMSATSTAMWNLTRACNEQCACSAVPYSPVCDEQTGTTYFSPCHAGCRGWNDRTKVYDRCECAAASVQQVSISRLMPADPFDAVDDDDGDDDTYFDLSIETTTTPDGGPLNRTRREAATDDRIMLPGACMAGCATAFYIYTGFACVINWLGATGRIGNILLNFRVVSVADKSFSQGLALMMVSLFALIPGPILYGYIIDNACLLWNTKCGQRGNCQLYDARQFRYYLNLTALTLTGVGVFFDVLVWWYGKDVDLYGEREEEAKAAASVQPAAEFRRRHQPISPLMAKK